MNPSVVNRVSFYTIRTCTNRAIVQVHSRLKTSRPCVSLDVKWTETAPKTENAALICVVLCAGNQTFLNIVSEKKHVSKYS